MLMSPAALEMKRSTDNPGRVLHVSALGAAFRSLLDLSRYFERRLRSGQASQHNVIPMGICLSAACHGRHTELLAREPAPAPPGEKGWGCSP